ncbi:hypothetical protein WJT74_10315 [Sphingomicrobium sp. XHP0239]
MTAARPASALPEAWWQSRLYLSALQMGDDVLVAVLIANVP